MSLSPSTEMQENWEVWLNYTNSESLATTIALNSMCLLVCSFGMAANGIVAFLLVFRIKRNKFTVYVFNLAVADFVFLLFIACLMIIVIVFFMQTQAKDRIPKLEKVHTVMLSIMFVSIFGYNTSLYLLMAISMERCLSVLCPIWYQCHRPKHQSAVVCSLLWILSCLMTSAEFFICDKTKILAKGPEMFIKGDGPCTVVFGSINVLSFFVFTPLMVISSVILLIKVKRDSWKQQSSKLYIVIVATIVFFLIFAMPMRVILQTQYVFGKLVPLVIVNVVSLLCAINSSVNPYVYWFVGQWGSRRGSFQMLLQKLFHDDTKPHNQQHLPATEHLHEANTLV